MIKNIIFDFGGVLLDIDYEATYRSMSELLQVDLSHGKMPESIRKILHDFETGSITEEVFLWRLQKSAPAPPQPRKLIDSWNAMLGPIAEEKLHMLLDLQKSYEVYLLSNTNSIHLDHVYRYLKKEHNIHHFDTKYFDKTYYSHLIGLRKPDHEIYRYVIKDLNLTPGASLFIDDLNENVEAARQVGLKAVHHDPKTNIAAHIADYLGH